MAQPPGWYDYPKLPDTQRYWDGARWTDSQRSTTGYKSSAAAGLLQLFFGWFGIGRFYIGNNGIAAAQLFTFIVGVVTTIFFVGFVILAVLAIWVFIDAIVLFTGNATDGEGRKLR